MAGMNVSLEICLVVQPANSLLLTAVSVQWLIGESVIGWSVSNWSARE